MTSSHSRPTPSVTVLTGLVAGLCAVAAVVGVRAQRDAPAAPPAADRAAVDRLLNGWSPGPRLAGQEMIAKYGTPREVTADRMIWHDAGPFKRIMLTRQELPHDFPLTHMDYLEHTISYNVPPDKADEVFAFDSSMTIYRVGGELSARCDLESNNVLTFNLAHEVVTGKKTVDQARKEFGQAVTDRTLGNPPPSTVSLQFAPAQPGSAADPEKTTIAGSPQRASSVGARPLKGASAPANSSGGDAESLAVLIAIDENEVHAAMAAQEKKIGEPVLTYAKTLHRDHGKSIHDTQQLAVQLGITPVETAVSDELHATGASHLAMLVPMTAAEFSANFVAQMVTGHRNAITMLDQHIAKAQHAEVKAHLTAARQHVERHLKEAERLPAGSR